MSDNISTEDSGSSRVSRISKAELDAIKNGTANSSKSVLAEQSSAGNQKVSKISKAELDAIKAGAEQSSTEIANKSTGKVEPENKQAASDAPKSQMDEARAYLMSLLGGKSKDSDDESEDATNTSDKASSSEPLVEVPEEQAEDNSQNEESSNDNHAVEDLKAEENSKPQTDENQEPQEEAVQDGQALETEMENLLDVGDEARREASKKVPSTKDIVSSPDELEITENDGKYTSNLDFTKNMSVRRHKLPLPKLPFIILGISVVLVALIVSIIMVVQYNKPPEPVTIVSVKLNASVIDAGYVGEEVDLRGLYIECRYSDGTHERIYDVDDYIKSYSAHFDQNGVILQEGHISSYDNGVIYFEYEGNQVSLKANTYKMEVASIESVTLSKNNFVVGNVISYSDILVLVEFEKLGTKVLSIAEMQDNLICELEGVNLESNTEGFIIPSSYTAGTRSLLFKYMFEGEAFEYSLITITLDLPVEDIE